MVDFTTPDPIRQAIVERIDALRPLIEDIARSLYQNPELGLAEVFASRKIRSVLEDAGFPVEADIAGPVTVPGPVSAVFNLACPASPVDFEPLSIEIMQTCSQGVLNMLNLAPDIQEEILFLPPTMTGRDPISERALRLVTAIVRWDRQRKLWRGMREGGSCKNR